MQFFVAKSSKKKKMKQKMVACLLILCVCMLALPVLCRRRSSKYRAKDGDEKAPSVCDEACELGAAQYKKWKTGNTPMAPFLETLLSLYDNSCELLQFVDVGANVGEEDMLATEIPRLCDDKSSFRLHLFEPNPYVFKRLSGVAERDERLSAYNIAVAAQSGLSLPFHAPANRDGFQKGTLSRLPRENPHARTVQRVLLNVNTTSLDDFLDAHLTRDGETLALLKVDVEGYEYEVFKGAQRSLQAARAPIIVYESHGSFNAAGWPYPANVEFFASLGYDSWLMFNKKLFSIDFPFLSVDQWRENIGAESNVIAVHRQWPMYERFLEEYSDVLTHRTTLGIRRLQRDYGPLLKRCNCFLTQRPQ
jgi:FkbM family methyltransferase